MELKTKSTDLSSKRTGQSINMNWRKKRVPTDSFRRNGCTAAIHWGANIQEKVFFKSRIFAWFIVERRKRIKRRGRHRAFKEIIASFGIMTMSFHKKKEENAFDLINGMKCMCKSRSKHKEAHHYSFIRITTINIRDMKGEQGVNEHKEKPVIKTSWQRSCASAADRRRQFW